jgi:outer membrane protein
MSSPKPSSILHLTELAALLGLLVTTAPAFALQPLTAFVAAARTGNADEHVAALTAVQQDAEALVSLGRTLPAATARFVYTRNQFEAKIDPSQFAPAGLPSALPTQPLVIQPRNQLDAYFQLDVPIVDAAGWTRTAAARANVRAAEHSARATMLDVQKQIANSYYQLVGAAALQRAAVRTLEAAHQNLALTEERQSGGVATPLEVERATAEVAHAERSISDTELSAELARRALRTLSGLAPEGDAPEITDDLHEEVPLERYEAAGVSSVPAVRAASSQREGAEDRSLAAKLAFLPTVSASAQEHLTNASGFFGHNAIWIATATANWRIDVTTLGTMRSERAGAELARVKERAARQVALDRIHESWFRVHNGIAKSRAARAEASAANAAVVRARERYQQGAGTQLELVQAERDAFSAEVSRIQADAELAYSRAALRLDAGQSLAAEETP